MQPTGVPADPQARGDLLALLAPAFDAVQTGPVQIDFEMDEDGTESTASILVDRSQGLVDSTWVQISLSGSEITTRSIVVDRRIFLKSTTDPATADLIEFAAGGESSAADLLDRVYTAFGRFGPSLDRMLAILESVPFRIDNTESGGSIRATVSIETSDVVAFFEQTGLEVASDHVPDGHVIWTFVIEDGHLSGIEVSGIQFFDGEAIETTADVTYIPIAPFALEPPR